jgi:hypothetical protein
LAQEQKTKSDIRFFDNTAARRQIRQSGITAAKKEEVIHVFERFK